MLDFLYNIDLSIFHFINFTLANPVFDLIMPIITSVKFWMPIYIISLALLMWKGGKKGRFLALVLIVGIVISDQTNSTFLKSLFDRVRPCHTVETARLLIGCPGGLSFPSSHAFNNFCAAMIISMFYSDKKWIFLSIAGVIAFTRPYCGVHYPSDILAGAVLGSILGYILAISAQKLAKKYFNYDVKNANQPLPE